MRIHWSIKKIALAALICVLIGAGGLLILFRQGAMDEQSVPVHLEKSLNGAEVESFSLTTDIPDVTFIRSDSNDIRIRMTGNIYKADVSHAEIELTTKGNGTDVVAEVHTSKRFQIGINFGQIYSIIHNDLKVVVELPEKTYRALEVQTDTGSITLPSLLAESLVLRSDTGEITLEGFTGKRLTATTDTGTMRLRRISAELKLGSDTGDLHIDLAGLPAGLDLSTDTGDIELTLGQAVPLEADFATDTGKTTANTGSGSFDFETKEKHKLRAKLNNGGPLIKARSDTGDIRLTVK